MRNRITFLKLFAICTLVTVICGFFSLIALNHLADSTFGKHREEFLLFLSDSIERRIQNLNNEEIAAQDDLFDLRRMRNPMDPAFHAPGPPPLDGVHVGPPLDAPHDGPPPPPLRRPPISEMWIVTAEGQIVLGKPAATKFKIWDRLEKPDDVREVKANEDFFRFGPSYAVIKIKKQPALFLVTKDDRNIFSAPFIVSQILFTFGTMVMAFVFTFAFLFFYLRRKSAEARSVLLRLERGDLKARFEIQRFDEFSGLFDDFNRMAGEIEKLVNRIHHAEASRRHLLQELGHDLRTPLTSLNTSLEVLQEHFEKMSSLDRKELLDLMGGEIGYFKDLLDKLLTIAVLDEPHYKESTETIDIAELFQQEIKIRKNPSDKKIMFQLKDSTGQNGQKSALILGDSHLIRRLIKNALDNATRYAKSEVVVELSVISAQKLQIQISDDGLGIDEKEAQSFGIRREFRARQNGSQAHLSLRLGSVIMRTIVELHDGEIFIGNKNPARPQDGALLLITLPLENAAA